MIAPPPVGAALRKVRDGGAAEVEDALDVDAQHAVDIFVRRIGQHAEGADTGIVDQHVERAEPVDRLVDNLGGEVGFGNVAGNDQRAVCVQRFGDLLAVFPAARIDDDIGALLGEAAGDALADAAAGAGDDDGGAGEAGGCGHGGAFAMGGW